MLVIIIFIISMCFHVKHLVGWVRVECLRALRVGEGRIPSSVAQTSSCSRWFQLTAVLEYLIRKFHYLFRLFLYTGVKIIFFKLNVLCILILVLEDHLIKTLKPDLNKDQRNLQTFLIPTQKLTKN